MTRPASLDHLVSAGEQRRRDFEAEQPRSDKRSEDEVKPVGGPWPDPEAREQMSQADARGRWQALLARHSITSSARHSFEDYVARDMFGEPRHDEEEHIDFSETQLDLVAKVGLDSLCLAPHRKA